MDQRGERGFPTLLRSRLREARWRAAVRGVLALAAVAAAVVAGGAWLLGGLARPPAWLAAGLAVSAAAVVVAAAWLLLAGPLWRLGGRRRFSGELDRRGGFANRIVAAEEALRRPERWDDDSRVSAELGLRVRRQAAEVLAGARLSRLLPLPAAGLSLLGAVGGALLCGWLLTASGGRLEAGLQALAPPWGPGTDVASLQPVGGPPSVVAGQDLELGVLDFGRVASPVVCEVRRGDGAWQEAPCRIDSLQGDGPFRRWLTTLTDVREDLAYRFRRGDEATAATRVAVLHPPLLTDLAGRLEPPAYTGLPAQDLPRLPARLEALAGSRLLLRGRASKPLAAAALIGEERDSVALATAADSLAGALTVSEPLRFRVGLRDRDGLAGGSDVAYEVAVLPDGEPLVELRRPGDDGLLPGDGRLDLVVRAADDYGLAALDLLVRREGPGGPPPGEEAPWRRLRLWSAAPESAAASGRIETGFGPLEATWPEPRADEGPPLDLQLQPRLDAGRLDLMPRDALLLCVEASDGRRPGPPGRGRSRVLRLTVPSAAEILASSQGEGGTDRLAELQELRRRGSELEGDLERLRRELLKNPVPDWTRQQELREAAGSRQAMQDELERIAGELRQDLSGLARNDLTSLELLERADEIAALLGEVRSEELDALMERLREAVGELTPPEVADAVREVGRKQEEMLRRLDRALAMLKDLRREQELEGMTSLLAQLLRRQHELLEQGRRSAAAADSAAADREATERQATDREDADSEADRTADRGAQADSSGTRPDGGGQAAADSADAGERSAEEALTAAEAAARQEALADELARLREQLTEALERLQAERSGQAEPSEGQGEPQQTQGEPPEGQGEPEPGAEPPDRADRADEGGDSPAAEQLAEALREALERLEESGTERSMREAARDLQGDPSAAAPQQQQALSDLAALYHVMLRSQQAMQAAMQQQQVGSLRRLAADMLAMSERQEELADGIPSDLRDVRSGDLTRRQFRVLQAVRQVRQRLRENPAGPAGPAMRLLDELDELEKTIETGVKGLEEGRGATAGHAARRGLGQMNRITIGLLTQAQTCSGGGGGGGSCQMPSLARQLRQMAEEQAGLNGLTEQMRRSLQEQRLSQQLRARMQRLEAGQQRLAQRARELAEQQREQPDGERLLGDLDRLARDMEGVSRDLGEGLVDEQTLVRQERILGRLLDAHNSARRRDFSARRESQAARELFAPQAPTPADVAEEGTDDRLRRRAPVREAPLEYRELVRRYFQALEDLQRPVQEER